MALNYARSEADASLDFRQHLSMISILFKYLLLFILYSYFVYQNCTTIVQMHPGTLTLKGASGSIDQRQFKIHMGVRHHPLHVTILPIFEVLLQMVKPLLFVLMTHVQQRLLGHILNNSLLNLVFFHPQSFYPRIHFFLDNLLFSIGLKFHKLHRWVDFIPPRCKVILVQRRFHLFFYISNITNLSL